MSVTETSMPTGAIELLGGQGFIARLDENCAGSDLTVANAARVSFGRRSTELSSKDEKLIAYLAEHKHMSPFRHPQISFHLKMPEALMRQAYKHVVGIDWTSGSPPIKDHAWNEISGRYIVYDSVYEPPVFRPQSDDNKQASEDGDLSGKFTSIESDSKWAACKQVRLVYQEAIAHAQKAYNALIEAGVAKEQARLLMPFATFTEVIWTTSLEAVVHFVKLRQHPGAQWEIRELADAVEKLTSERFPICTQALVKYL